MSNTMILEVNVKPEKTEEFLGIMKGALPDTRAYDGCQKLELRTDEGKPGRVLLLQVWDSKAHQEKYFAWRVETGMMDSIKDFLTAEPSVTWLADHGSW